jgi:hypothetical protein
MPRTGQYSYWNIESLSSTLRNQRVRSAGIIGGIAALSVMLFLFDPATSMFFGRCPFFTITGLHCPGCGTLRALHQLLHLNISAALQMNPLTVFTEADPFQSFSCLPHGFGLCFQSSLRFGFFAISRFTLSLCWLLPVRKGSNAWTQIQPTFP